MTWIMIIILAAMLLIFIGLFITVKHLILARTGFEELMVKFIEYNQEFYEGQRKIIKGTNEIVINSEKVAKELTTLLKPLNTFSDNVDGVVDTSGELKTINITANRNLTKIDTILRSSKDINASLKKLDMVVKSLERFVKR